MKTLIKLSAGKIFLIVFLGLFSVSACFVIIAHFDNIEKATHERLERMDAIVSTFLLEVDGKDYKALMKKFSTKDAIVSNEDSKLYNQLHTAMKACALVNEVETPMYSIHLGSEDSLFFGVTSSESPYFRHEYADPPNDLKKKYYEGGKIYQYSTNTGEWLSVVQPIMDGDEVVGAIEIDHEFGPFLEEAKADLMKKSIISLTVYVLVGLVMFRLISRVINVEEEEKRIQKSQLQLKSYEHEQLNSSISYAKKIQHALWPSNEILSNTFADFFSINMPKDVVGGDFYWHYKIKGSDKMILIHADCTGHGVPGAMMSVLGNSIFNEIICTYDVYDPSQILRLANKKLITLLQQEKEENLDDGMAVSVMLVDKETMSLKFSGANQNSLIVRNGQKITLEGDKYPVGGAHFNPDRSYTSRTVMLEKKDALYLFSDGFKDQFGGPSNKKYQASNFYNLLSELSIESMNIQKEKVLNVFRTWKGNREQIDDVSLVGIRI